MCVRACVCVCVCVCITDVQANRHDAIVLTLRQITVTSPIRYREVVNGASCVMSELTVMIVQYACH